MYNEITKVTTPFRLTVVVLAMTIGLILGTQEYLEGVNETRLRNLAEHTNGDPVTICRYTECDYIKVGDRFYWLDKDTGTLMLYKTLPLDNMSLADSLILSTEVLTNYDIVVYTNNYIETISRVIHIWLPIMTLFMIIMGFITQRKLINISEYRVANAIEKSSLEGNLRMFVAATAHHEMLTPIAVIRASVDDLSTISRDTDCDVRMGPIFNILSSTVDRLESVLNQMSSDRRLHKKSDPPMLDIIINTLNSLRVLYTITDFEYHVYDEAVFSSVSNYKLDTGTVSNIFNNLFKNSLEAGSTVIRIVPVINDDMLEVLVMDNGSGVSIPPGANKDIVFKLKYSNKDIDILDVHRKLNSSTAPRGDGLYLVRAILMSAGGNISLVKTSVSGTVFKVVLPIKHREVADEGKC